MIIFTSRAKSALRNGITWLKKALKAIKFRSLLVFYRSINFCVRIGNRIIQVSTKFLATIFSFAASVGLVTLADKTVIDTTGGVHLASSGIIATALTLVLSISIIPAQKAADAFSTAILALYKREHVFVFSSLAALSIFSLVLGTGWTLGLGADNSIAVQVLVLGIALDALRAFYIRSLDLLVPRTALGLVEQECERLISRNSRRIKQVAQIIPEDRAEGDVEKRVAPWFLHSRSSVRPQLVAWVAQLEEFAHKALARHDTEAAQAAIDVMGSIASRYVDSRQDSLVLVPDLTDILASPQSDISEVLNPIYESMKAVLDHSVREHQEGPARSCIQVLGRVATHLMAIISEEGPVKSAPLAYAPVYYLGECAKKVSKMPDALMDVVRAMGSVFSKVRTDIDTSAIESASVDNLLVVAMTAYPERSIVPAHQAVDMMMKCAILEIQVRGHRPGSILQPVLKDIELIVPGEIAMEKLGLSQLQTLPPYDITNANKLVALFQVLVSKIELKDDETWINPFSEFNKCSEVVVHHYRELAKKTSEAGMLRYWILNSCMDAADVHVDVIAKFADTDETHVGSVENRLIWFIHTPEFFFNEANAFENANMVRKIPERLAKMGIRLLQLGRLEAAGTCAKVLASLAKMSTQHKPEKPYTTADILTNIEVLARSAAALGQPALESSSRGLKNIEMADAETKGHLEAAVLNRASHLDERLQRANTRFALDPKPEDLLAELLGAKKSESKRKAIQPPEVVPTIDHESQILAAFERKKFNPLSLQKVSKLTQMRPKDVEESLLALGASRTITKEGSEVWNLPDTRQPTRSSP